MKSETILKQLLHMVNAPFSEYEVAYNRLCNSKDIVKVNMDEDSDEATIIEDALIVAGIAGHLTSDTVLNILEQVTEIDVKQGKLYAAYRDHENIKWDVSLLIKGIRI